MTKPIPLIRPELKSLCDSYNKLYQAHLEAFHERIPELGKEETDFCDFYPGISVLQEKKDKKQFLILGQAVNGWNKTWNHKEPISSERWQESLEYSNYCWVDDRSPLEWVNARWSKKSHRKYFNDEKRAQGEFYGIREKDDQGNVKKNYEAYRSFFWQVTYKLICDVNELPDGRDDKSWNEYMTWSNLYKIAPNRKNPGREQRKVQRQIGAVNLIRKELEQLRPDYCIVLTNEKWWQPFKEELKTEELDISSKSEMIESVEYFISKKIRIPVIVTKRPRFGNSNAYVKAIKSCLNQLQD